MVSWAFLNVIPVFALGALKSVGGASCHLLKAYVCSYRFFTQLAATSRPHFTQSIRLGHIHQQSSSGRMYPRSLGAVGCFHAPVNLASN